MGLTEAELQLTELLGEVLELLRWNQVLGYSNQYLLREKLGLLPEEGHRVMQAAAGAVEADGRTQDWGKRLMEIQRSLEAIHKRMIGATADRLVCGGKREDSSACSGDAAAEDAQSG